MSQTSRFIRPLIEFFFPGASPETILLIHAFIRKSAHFIEYGLLALLAARASFWGVSSKVREHWIVFSIGLVAAVAGVDEINQSFLSSRTGSGWDVLLDVAGGFTALVAIALVGSRRSR